MFINWILTFPPYCTILALFRNSTSYFGQFTFIRCSTYYLYVGFGALPRPRCSCWSARLFHTALIELITNRPCVRHPRRVGPGRAQRSPRTAATRASCCPHVVCEANTHHASRTMSPLLFRQQLTTPTGDGYAPAHLATPTARHTDDR